MASSPAQTSTTPARPYALALRDMAGRYEDLVRGLSILKQIDSFDDPQLTLREICIGLLQTIAQNVLADNCSLMMLDSSGEYLELWAATGFLEDSATWIEDQSTHTKFRVGEGFAGRAVATGRPVNSDDVTDDTDFLPLPETCVKIRSLMCFPLKVAGQPIGVMNLSRSAPPAFGRDVECMMELVAERCARLLASHRLHSIRRDNEQYHRLVCENAGDGILVFDPTGKLVIANSVAASLLETPLEELMDGRASCTQNVIAEDLPALDASRAAAMSGSQPSTVEYRVRGASGAVRHLEERSSAVIDPQGRPSRRVCVLRDTTDRKQAEESRQLLEAQLYHAQKMEALGELAGGVTHDFNNLLTGILGSAGLARTTDDVVELRELLADIETAAGRASGLTRQLLSMSRRALPVRRPVDIASLLDEVGGVVRNTFDRKIQIAIQYDFNLGMALADSGQIHQMLLNLCVNARDALLEKAQTTGADDLRITLQATNVSISEAYCRSHIEASPGTNYLNPSLWLCRPDLPNDACHVDLTATEIRPDGSHTLERHTPASAPAVDCFYVYPTVDMHLRAGNHTDLQDTERVRSVVAAQIARFTEVCAVYAPLYRQASIGTYMSSPEDQERFFGIGFSDVAAAFDLYLRRYNQGRKIVIIGHSQGAQMAAMLLRQRFDHDEALRRQLVVAMPIGFYFDVPSGAQVGGSFENLPMCTRDDQQGCVVSYRSLAAGDVPDPKYWKLPQGREAICVEPTASAQGSHRLSRSFFPSSRANDTQGVSTPFVLVRDLYEGRCVKDPGGRNYLQIAEARAEGDQRPRLVDLSRHHGFIGLHIFDFQFSQGDLIDLIRRKGSAAR